MSIAPLGSGPSALVHLHHGAPLVASDAVADAGDDGEGDGSGSAGAVVDAPDSATFSDQAVALLQAQQAAPVQDGGWKMTETQAAQLSAAIQQADPSLFDHLDQNGDGRLNADELKTGIHQLAQQVPAGSGSAGGAATTPDQLETIRQALQSMLGGGLPGAHRHHHHQAVARGSAAAPAAPVADSAVVGALAGTSAAGDSDGAGDSGNTAPAAPQRSLADLLAELDRSAH